MRDVGVLTKEKSAKKKLFTEKGRDLSFSV